MKFGDFVFFDDYNFGLLPDYMRCKALKCSDGYCFYECFFRHLIKFIEEDTGKKLYELPPVIFHLQPDKQ